MWGGKDAKTRRKGLGAQRARWIGRLDSLDSLDSLDELDYLDCLDCLDELDSLPSPRPRVPASPLPRVQSPKKKRTRPNRRIRFCK